MTPEAQSDVVARYLDAVDAQTGAAPTSYLPPQSKRYPGSPRTSLPWPGPGAPPLTDTGLDRISTLLLGYGPRRVEMLTQAGMSALTGTPFSGPAFTRVLPAWFTLRWTVPSGGAYYPGEIYLAWTGSGDLPSGVYHYDHVHHCLELLRDTNPAADVDRLLGPATATDGAGRSALLLACRPWKNGSKYRAFGYQLATVDVGVLLGQLLTWPQTGTADLAPDPRAADDLLGLDGMLETVYAVIEISTAATPDTPPEAGTPPGPDTPPGPGTPPCRTAPPEPVGLTHDRLVLADADPHAVALHRAAWAETDMPRRAVPPPAPQAMTPSDAAPVHLPEVAALDLTGAAAGRASACDLAPGLRLAQLADVLAYAGGHRPTTAALDELARHPLYPTLWCLVGQVDGLPPGAYRYDPRHHLLRPSTGADRPGPPTTVVAHRMATAGVSIVVVAGGGRPMTGLTPAEFRRLHLLTGTVVQLAALTAQAVGAAIRPIGGFSAPDIAARLGLPGGDTPVLQLLLGAPTSRAGLLAVALTEGTTNG
ncbi:hypothetical protein EYA84_07710 [Verrucosispora sp. SN26_14.1]|uniref:hypothetical protein n=1 Tax=Verrucosispora sp. SN26_14.1 TaxID=2527879 RepID=UPI0010347831|nr:hypothetical protein [Verrucosispora sp. SN26_14.1]TBL39843.1 hypothetical protein EYA84_07710 [Verrucosispora sp. SN26_14.1]